MKYLKLSKDCGKLIKTYRGHSEIVLSIQVDKVLKKFISASRDKSIKVWDLEAGKCLKTIKNQQPIIANALIPNNKFISAFENKTIKIWDLNTYECINTLESEADVLSLCLINENHIACSCDDGSINIWDLTTLTKVKSSKKDDCLLKLKLVYESKLIGCSSDNKIMILNLDTFECIKVLDGHSDKIYSLELTSDGNLLSCSEDKTVKLWELETGELLKSIDFEHPVNCIKVLNDIYIAVGLGDRQSGFIIIYNLFNKKILKQTRSFPADVNYLYLLPNGNLLSGWENGFINEWKSYIARPHIFLLFKKLN